MGAFFDALLDFLRMNAKMVAALLGPWLSALILKVPFIDQVPVEVEGWFILVLTAFFVWLLPNKPPVV